MFTVYTINQKDEWDSIVKTFKKYDVYYLSGYSEAFKLHGDGEPLLFYYETENLRGINVVMKRDIAHDKHFSGRISEGKYYDLSTPYGYGGWIIEGEDSENGTSVFIDEYTSWCRDNNVVSEFVRFHPVLENASGINKKMYMVDSIGKTVAIQLDNKDAIWERFSSKNRGHIRVAKKEGVAVRNENSKEAFDVFQRIYETTMDRDDASSYYYFDKSFFESIRNDLKGYYTLFTAYLGNQAIASSIMLHADNYMNYHLSGQLFEYRRYAGTNMILYEAAKWGCSHGYDWLHLGGGLGAKKGPLYDFKKSFYKKGVDKSFYIGKRITDYKAYQFLINARIEEISDGFFPEYRS